MQWADVIAKSLLEKGRKHLLSTGISPSGHIHVGSLREAITANAVRKALVDQGADVKLIYLVDDYDPLRKRYPFLPECYDKEVGRPLCQIPCPGDKCHDSYGAHFIQPFLDAIAEMGIHPEVHWTHKVYEEGKFAELTDLVIREKDKVATILREVTGRDVPANFWPVSPQCGSCGHFTDRVTSYEYPFVHYKCHCGHEGKADLRTGEAKLPWRLEWAAKWKIFGVTCEPFGKDHAAAGGSYESGVRFCKELFDIDPPYPIPYEFIQFKGKGQMHKSTGHVVTGTDALKITPAPVLNFSVLRYNPDRHIDYDPGLGILDVVDEYDHIESLYFKGGADDKEKDLLRAYEIAQPKSVRTNLPMQVPYRHLVHVVQTAETFEGIMKIIDRTEGLMPPTPEDIEVLKERCECVRYWLDNFAPDEVKFAVAKMMPAVELTGPEKTYFSLLHTALNGANWDPDAIHNAVYDNAKEAGILPKAAFQALYKIFVSRTSGPRLGYFLSTLDKSFVMKRLSEASA